MDSQHSHYCQATLTYLGRSNLWLFCAAFDDTLATAPPPLFFLTETQDRGVSRFTAPAFAGLLDFKRKSYLCTPEA